MDYYRSFIFIVIVCLATGCATEQTSTIDHSRYFLTPKDLSSSIKYKKPLESFHKTNFGDGSYEMEYQYDSPDDNVYVYQFISIENNPEKIASTYKAIKTGTKLGVISSGASSREVASNFSWGEESSLREYEKDGKYLGMFFIARKSNKIYSILLKGVKPDNQEVWTQTLLPRLEKLEYSQAML